MKPNKLSSQSRIGIVPQSPHQFNELRTEAPTTKYVGLTLLQSQSAFQKAVPLETLDAK